jgi:osmotically-inducible protein OsmY
MLIMTGALSGCAVYDTYEKCGFHGCPGDAKITADVRSQFNQCSFLESNAIKVQTLNHVVFLGGVVASGLEIDTAGSIARSVPDVVEVVNSMVVSASR